ncbi:phage scaffolding protein [Marinilactibacillus sp. Marseille-P9653]|uniref:phage scaffolding protein n=1 Tax=Marinilactibacillus sp. Marseille-P9653 TaxID=2866583 RepID=UPI001CE3FCBD|nr:phage scaffolding protein [Marinilactibacillus sp. Marseille-P9653]
MERSYLENLGLESDVISQIMKEHGKTVNPLKESLEDAGKEKKQLDDRIAQHEQQLEELKKKPTDSEGLNDKIEQLQKENKELKESKEAELAEERRVNKIALSVKGLNTADEDFVSDKLRNLQLDEEGNLIDFDKHVDVLKEKHPFLFEGVKEEPKKPGKWSQGNSTVESGAMTKEDIMKEPDAGKRQQLISENAHLFRQ